MGANQSSSAGAGGSSQPAADAKPSYYELLAVERNATDDEIKKAYRRKALELHPDRNYGNVEWATKLFAEVQSAYEILSDPQERAWYDSHESAILRGDDPGDEGAHFEGNVKVTSADDIARMVRKFNSGVDFSDAPSGFFGYLRETFEQLAKEEEIAASWEGVDAPDYPSFGHKDDEYEYVVKPFYNMWTSFATKKTFAWKDKYRLSEAPDRRYRRLMEKENQKLREEGIREFNEAVRSLVAFVRKRDPRYIPSTQTEEERQKILRDAAAAQAARARAANEAQLKQEVPDWAQIVERDEHAGVIGEESESEEEHYECVACHKTFKSEKQWEAHEKSKKHQKAVQALRKKMQKENAHLNLESEPSSGIMTPMSDEEEFLEAVDEAAADDGETGLDATDEVETRFSKLDVDEEEDEGDEDGKVEKGSAVHATAATPSDSESDVETEDDDYASPDAIKDRLTSTRAVDSESEPEPEQSKPKLGKAAQKRAKRAAAAAAAESAQSNHTCATCNAAFPSKTRLHQHIKDHGHAALKSVAGTGGQGKKKKGKK
ncbi:hypothetical protein M8818_005846 [Zalaria obscura]|uniref:Uncharacterized protein n=1 Tax=Zalaria obscura TaxID=2024903 RepID=A0ACC3S8B5_9PEZI